MHQNTFFTTPEYLLELDSGGLEVCANASKHVLTPPEVKKLIF
jgi:hypothetical protein